LDQLSFFKEKTMDQFIGQPWKKFIQPNGPDAIEC
jgi:hypothetical protein